MRNNLVILTIIFGIYHTFAPITGRFYGLNGAEVVISLRDETPENSRLIDFFRTLEAKEAIAQKYGVNPKLINLVNGNGELDGNLEPNTDGEIRGNFAINQLPRLHTLSTAGGLFLPHNGEETDINDILFRLVRYDLTEHLTIWFKVRSLQDEDHWMFIARMSKIESIPELIPLSMQIAFTDRFHYHDHRVMNTRHLDTEAILESLYHQPGNAAPKCLDELAGMLAGLEISFNIHSTDSVYVHEGVENVFCEV